MASVIDTCIHQLKFPCVFACPHFCPDMCSALMHNKVDIAFLLKLASILLAVKACQIQNKLQSWGRTSAACQGHTVEHAMIKLTFALFFPSCIPKRFQFCSIPSGQVDFPLIIFYFFSIPLPLMSLLLGRFKRCCAIPPPLLKWDPFVIWRTAESPV